MQSTSRFLVTLALVGLSLGMMENRFGDVYEHFKADPLDFNEEDLHLLADAFYVDAHYAEAEKASLLNGIQGSLNNATNQTGEIGKLIDSTQGLIKVVKDAASQLANPGNLITNTLKSGWAKLFGRMLQATDKSSVAKFVDGLENKVNEAKSEQKSITNALSNSSKFLGLLQGVGQLLSGNTSGFKNALAQYMPSWFGSSARRLAAQEGHEGWMDFLSGSQQGAAQDAAASSQASWFDNLKTKLQADAVKAALGNSTLGSFLAQSQAANQPQVPVQDGAIAAPSKWDQAKSWASKLSNLYQTASAHLEHMAAKPDTSYGRHRKSLFQQQAEKHRLERMATSLRNAAHYLNGVDDSSINFNRVENHLFDLVQDGGATGKAYLRGVETLKCILLRINCPEIRVIPSGYTKTIYFGQNQAAQLKTLGPQSLGSGAQAVAEGNQVITSGTDTRVQLVPLDPNAAAVQPEQANIQPGILSGQWNFDSVAQTSGFNPSQGNEAIIVTNESPINRLPPVSDVVSGIQYTTLLNQHPASYQNQEFLVGGSAAQQTVQPSTFNIVQKSVSSGDNSVTTINTSGSEASASSNVAVDSGVNAQSGSQDQWVVSTAQAPAQVKSASTVNIQSSSSTVNQAFPYLAGSTLNAIPASQLSGSTLSANLASEIQKLASQTFTAGSATSKESLTWNDAEPVLVYETKPATNSA